MKFLFLIWINLKRKKVRTLLTIGSFAIALFLFGLLVTIHVAFHQGVEVAGADRLVVRNHISLIMPLPFSYKERLWVPGVKGVTFASWFGGVYQSEKNFFPQFSIDSETYLDMFPEYTIPPAQWTSFLKDRQGCIAGRDIAKRFGWKIGDRVPIRGTIYPGAWEFNLCGIFDGKSISDNTTQFWFHHKYLEENSPIGDRGMVGWYYVKVADPQQAPLIAAAIDEKFSNSPFETVTETEKAFAAGFLKQIGNIKFILTTVGIVIFFTLLLITGSNIAMSVRERTNEVAVFKTLGFSDSRIFMLVLSESMTYALAGGAIGIGLCKLFTMQGDPTKGMLPLFYLAPTYIVLGLAISAVVGLMSGIIPACLAMRLKIVDAMRRI